MSSTARRLEGYTLADWESLEPHEGRRIELVNGRFRVNAAPAVPHQRISDRLQTLLDGVVVSEGLEAYSAIGVRVGQSGYIPDLAVCVPTDEASVSSDDVKMVVEVLSPSTANIDRLEKPAAYAAAGIPVYWIVEVPKTGRPVVRCYVLSGDTYAESGVAASGNPAELAVTREVVVKVDVDTLFAPRRQPGTV